MALQYQITQLQGTPPFNIIICDGCVITNNCDVVASNIQPSDLPITIQIPPQFENPLSFCLIVQDSRECELCECVNVTPTPTTTITPTISLSPSITPSITPTNTTTPTTLLSPSITPSITPTNTTTPTTSLSPSITPTVLVSPSITPTTSTTPSNTVTPTNTVTPNNTVTPTLTPTSTVIIPVSDPTLEIYYQGQDGTYFNPVPNSGDTFTQWQDSSANAHNANPIGGGSGPSPEWWSNVQNGLGGVYFNGTTDGLSVNPLTDLQSVTGQTIIIVAKSLDSNATGQYVQGGSDGNTGLNETFLRQSGGTYDIRTAFGKAIGGVVDTEPHILTTVFSGTGINNEDRLKFRIDGCEQQLTFTDNVSGTTNPLIDYVYLGVSYTTAVAGVEQYFYNGFLFDVLIYSRALDNSELNLVENFIAGKWGLNTGCPTPTPSITPTNTPTVTPTVTSTPTNTPSITVTPSTSISVYQTFNVTNNGATSYNIDGSANPTLTLYRGRLYNFSISAVGHPFYIKTSTGTGTGNQYNDGVTNNGETNGILSFLVPIGAPNTLYYQCSIHSSMNGIINIIDEPVGASTTPSITPTNTPTP